MTSEPTYPGAAGSTVATGDRRPTVVPGFRPALATRPARFGPVSRRVDPAVVAAYRARRDDPRDPRPYADRPGRDRFGDPRTDVLLAPYGPDAAYLAASE